MWKPVLNFDETLEMTVEWYKSFKNENMHNFCLQQINKYMQKAVEKKLPWTREQEIYMKD